MVLTMRLRSRPPLDGVSIITNPINIGSPPLVTFDNPPVATTTTTPHKAQHQFDVKQENCSALARFLPM
jgi:hypothetical protein